MSHLPPKPEAKPVAPPKKGGALRMILIAVMLAMLGLLGWDLYARSAVASSFDKVVQWVGKDLEEYTPADVQKLLGRGPDNGLEDKKDYALETYSWPRGILVKSYYITVIYRKEGDKVLLHEVVKNTPPEANDLPNPPVAAAPPTTDDDTPAKEDDEPAETPASTDDDDPAPDSTGGEEQPQPSDEAT